MGILLYIKIKAAVGGRKKRSILPDILEIIQNIDTFVLHGNYPAAPLTLAMLFSREGMCVKQGQKEAKLVGKPTQLEKMLENLKLQ